MALYLEAASILVQTQGSLKSRIYNNPSLKSPAPRLYALVIETLKHQDVLNEVIAASGLLTVEKKLTHPLALALLHDLLLTKSGIVVSTGPLKAAMLKHKARLSAEFTRARLKRGFASTSALLAASSSAPALRLPRWVRVNPLKAAGGAAEVLKTSFAEYTVVSCIAALFPEEGEQHEQKRVYIDAHIPNLLAFPPATDLTSHPLYTAGALILQDKASCFPAVLLAPPAGARCIDGTAAPGNKTTHLAALLGSGTKGTVVAFEKDVRRGKILQAMVAKAGAGVIVEVRAGADFLQADPRRDARLKEATHILLDPSCSGSGIVSRDEYVLAPLPAPGGKAQTKPKKRKRAAEKIAASEADPAEEEGKDASASAARLASLAEFQRAIVQFAMGFPAARRITYSTCSVHHEENEDVVAAVLASKVARQRGWRVLTRKEGALREWPRRGERGRCADEVVAEACIRCEPVVDGGIGFFVVGFVREGNGDHWVPEEEEEEEEGGGEKEDEDEWEGFGDEKTAEMVDMAPNKAVRRSELSRKKKKAKKSGRNTAK